MKNSSFQILWKSVMCPNILITFSSNNWEKLCLLRDFNSKFEFTDFFALSFSLNKKTFHVKMPM